MEQKNIILRGLALKGLLATALCGAVGLANADQFGVQVAAGTADHHVRKIDLGLAWDPNLTWWHIGDWQFALIGEAHVAWWHTDEGNVHDNIGEFGLTPIIRFRKSSGYFRPYLEAGDGVRLLTSPTISSRYTLSTAFQFADMVGVGLAFGSSGQYRVGYRFQHISNASIKRPNPGIDFQQVYFEYMF